MVHPIHRHTSEWLAIRTVLHSLNDELFYYILSFSPLFRTIALYSRCFISNRSFSLPLLLTLAHSFSFVLCLFIALVMLHIKVSFKNTDYNAFASLKTMSSLPLSIIRFQCKKIRIENGFLFV